MPKDEHAETGTGNDPGETKSGGKPTYELWEPFARPLPPDHDSAGGKTYPLWSPQ